MCHFEENVILVWCDARLAFKFFGLYSLARYFVAFPMEIAMLRDHWRDYLLLIIIENVGTAFAPGIAIRMEFNQFHANEDTHVEVVSDLSLEIATGSS